MAGKRVTIRKVRGPISTEPRVLVLLLVDVSGSTSIFTTAMTTAMSTFREAVLRDTLLVRKLEWAFVTFSDSVQVVYPHGPITEFESPRVLEHGHGTAMGTAVLEALRLQAEHAAELVEQGIPIQHKFIFLVTDGYPTHEPPGRFVEAVRLIDETAESSAFSFFSFALEGADLKKLGQLTPWESPVRLSEVGDFRAFFRWLNESLRQVSRSRPGDAIELPDPRRSGLVEGPNASGGGGDSEGKAEREVSRHVISDFA